MPPELDAPADFIVPAPPEPKIETPPAPPVEGGKPDPTAAPAADTAKPPIEFTTPAEAALTPPSDNIVVYNPTGDAGLDVALRYVGARGFGPDHPAIVAATKGNFGVLEKELAALGDKADGYGSYVALAKDSYGRRQAAVKAENEAVAAVVYKAAGGAEQWALVQKWAQENADPAEKKSLNAGLKAGGVTAAAVAERLTTLYKRAQGKPKSVVKPDTATTATVESGALDPKQFGKASAQLYAKLGNRMQASAEYQQLVARRRAYRG